MRRLLTTMIIVVGFASLLALAVAGPFYQLQWLDLGSAFLQLRWAAYVAIGVLAIGLPWLIWQVITPSQQVSRRQTATLLVALVAAGVTVAIPASQLQTARSVPPIHDISTDTLNPPVFVAIAPLRADAPNPVDYAGAETAAQQAQAYPQIQPFNTSVAAALVFEQALLVVAESGWELVAADADSGRIEATDTTTWFGFKDDVVIRITATDDGSRVDVRSKSRVGRSDVGVNAKRIEGFLTDLQRRL